MKMRPPADHMECPKCGAISGDDWSQCGDACPMPGSPLYDGILDFKLNVPSAEEAPNHVFESSEP